MSKGVSLNVVVDDNISSDKRVMVLRMLLCVEAASRLDMNG